MGYLDFDILSPPHSYNLAPYQKGYTAPHVSPRSYRVLTNYMVERTFHMAPYLVAFGCLFNTSVTHIWFKRCFNIPKRLLERGGQLTLSYI